MVSKEYPRIGRKSITRSCPTACTSMWTGGPSFRRATPFFATNYGGMDMKFRLDGQWRDTPAGVAHFLEHKMFDTEDGNASRIWRPTGLPPTPSPARPSPATILKARRNSATT